MRSPDAVAGLRRRLRGAWRACALVAAIGMHHVPALAQAPAPGKAASPRLAVCAACHGADGNSQMPNSPSLAGQPKVFLENQLIVIREGLRIISQMTGLLDGVADEEISAIAAHFASQPAKSSAGARRDAQFERGRELAARMQCGSCHLPTYEGRQQMPRLGAQREDYLVHSMRQFRDNKATGRDTIMAAALYGVSDKDIEDMAHFLAHTK